MHLHQILNVLAPIQALIIGLLFFKFFNSIFKTVFVFVCFAAFTEGLGQILIHVFSKTTLWMSHFYVMIEFFIWALVYWLIMKSFIKKNFFWTIVILFELYCIFNLIFIQSVYEYPFARSIEGILIVLFSVTKFHKIMVEGEIKHLIKDPIVWINAAVLFYFVSILSYNLLFTVLLNDNIEFLRRIIAYFLTSINVLFYLVLSGSFYLQKLKSSGLEKNYN